MAPARRSSGQPVDRMPRASPAMMFVAAPVWAASATRCAGLFDSEV